MDFVLASMTEDEAVWQRLSVVKKEGLHKYTFYTRTYVGAFTKRRRYKN